MSCACAMSLYSLCPVLISCLGIAYVLCLYHVSAWPVFCACTIFLYNVLDSCLCMACVLCSYHVHLQPLHCACAMFVPMPSVCTMYLYSLCSVLVQCHFIAFADVCTMSLYSTCHVLVPCLCTAYAWGLYHVSV